MNWTAIVPLKEAPNRKTRLAPDVDEEQRIALTQLMVRHVIGTLRKTPGIDRILMLSPERQDGLDAQWSEDRGAGLNAELDRVRANLNGAVLVIHADLPLLISDEVVQLLRVAEHEGMAIAPDRHGEGTNAIALADARSFTFSFGQNSFATHCAHGIAAVVRRPGLSLDVDTPEDLDAARAAGMRI